MKAPTVQEGRAVPSPDRIGILKLDYDQSCNLICRGCRTQHSSHWVQFDKVKTIHTTLLNSDSLKHANQLYITGAGDPFASPFYWEILRDLPKLAPDPSTRLLIHTNGLLFTPSNWKRLGETTRRIETICVSIDASCPATYDINRGGDWDVLMKNLSFIASIHTRSICLVLFFVVQLNNFMEMPAFVRLGNKFSANHINFVALQNWSTFEKREYLNRAIHLPSHPQHGHLLETMRAVRSMKTKCSITPLDVITNF